MPIRSLNWPSLPQTAIPLWMGCQRQLTEGSRKLDSISKHFKFHFQLKVMWCNRVMEQIRNGIFLNGQHTCPSVVLHGPYLWCQHDNLQAEEGGISRLQRFVELQKINKYWEAKTLKGIKLRKDKVWPQGPQNADWRNRINRKLGKRKHEMDYRGRRHGLEQWIGALHTTRICCRSHLSLLVSLSLKPIHRIWMLSIHIHVYN